MHYHLSPPTLRVRRILNATLAGYREVARPIFGGSHSSGPEIGRKKRPKQVAGVREECAEGEATPSLRIRASSTAPPTAASSPVPQTLRSGAPFRR